MLKRNNTNIDMSINSVYTTTNNATNTPYLNTDGQLMIGNSNSYQPSASTLTAGAGINITNGHGSITIAATGAANNLVVVTAPLTMANGMTYGVTATTLCFLTLPTTIPQGGLIIIENWNSTGGFKIAQNTGQQILFQSSATTSGTGGYLINTNYTDTVWIRCIVANTTFSVVSSVGNIGIN